MILFKTRHEVKKLQEQIEFLTGMLKANLNIKYTLDDFHEYCELHPNSASIPVSENERLHFIQMLTYDCPPTHEQYTREVSFEGKKVVVNKK